MRGSKSYKDWTGNSSPGSTLSRRRSGSQCGSLDGHALWSRKPQVLGPQGPLLTLEISYKTAWFLCHRIRNAMREMNAAREIRPNHSKEEWVCGHAHTNGAESVWSLLKRSIKGSYHKVSMKHLDAYLGELEHRFNNRDNEYLFRDTLLKLANSERLTFKGLVDA